MTLASDDLRYDKSPCGAYREAAEKECAVRMKHIQALHRALRRALQVVDMGSLVLGRGGAIGQSGAHSQLRCEQLMR